MFNIALQKSLNPSRRGTRGVLMLSTALGAIAVGALAAPEAAVALPAGCAPIVSGGVDTATCTSGGNTYPTGIQFTDGGNSATLVLDPGVSVIDATAFQTAVSAQGVSGGVTIIDIAAGDSISSQGNGVVADNDGGTSQIVSGADVTAYGRGLWAWTNGFSGNASITNTGDVSVHSLYAGGYAAGIVEGATANAYVHNTGDITVSSSGLGAGIYVDGQHASTVYNSGAITVTATGFAAGIATQIYGTPVNYANITNTGDIIAISSSGEAAGVLATADYDVSVVNTGTIYTVGPKAYGISVKSLYTDAYVYQAGDISVFGQDGATGVSVIAEHGNATLREFGSVEAEATSGNATAVYVKSDASIYIGGDAVALAGPGFATGVSLISGGYGGVDVQGNVIAIGGAGASGVALNAAGDANVYVGGNVVAIASGGYATGVGVFAGGNVAVSVAGDITAVGLTGSAGVFASGYTASVGVGGNITAVAAGNAYGVRATGFVGADVSVGGNVTVISALGDATGVSGISLGDVDIAVEGATSVESIAGRYAQALVGVSYYGDVAVTAGGPITAQGAFAEGVGAYAFNGDVTVNVGDVTVHGLGYYSGAAGIRTYATGVTRIYAHDIYTTGGEVDGIHAGSTLGGGGDTYISVNQVVTTGAFSNGIYVNGSGNVTINDNIVETTGYAARGIDAVSYAGGVTVNSGTVITHGDFSYGIYVFGAETVTVNSGFVETSGYASAGIVAGNVYGPGTPTVTVNSGTVITSGDFSPGILVYSYPGSATIVSNYIRTAGAQSDGIKSFTGYGTSIENAGLIKTEGFHSYGIYAQAFFGDVQVQSNEVVTYGDLSGGIFAIDLAGSITIDSGAIYTFGYNAWGIGAIDIIGNITIDSGFVYTAGDHANGIYARDVFGQATVTSSEVVTKGDYAIGIEAFGRTGVTVNSGEVFTYGDYSPGIYAAAPYGDVAISSGVVVTHGAYSNGIDAFSAYGQISVTSNYVHTDGFFSAGIYAVGYADVSVNSGTVITHGDLAYGIFAYSSAGDVSISSGAVITTGFYSHGVAGISIDGTTSITSGYVRTAGDYALGIDAFGYAGATVTSGTVITEGFAAPGIIAISVAGETSVTSHYVRTGGDFAEGIFGYGFYGSYVHNTGEVITEGYYAPGISAKSVAGDATVVSDLVITAGYNSRGVEAGSRYGDASITSVDTRTYGDHSDAIDAFSIFGDANVTSSFAYTAGDHSAGISARSVFADVNVTSNEVITEGDYSPGIYTYAELAGSTTIHSGAAFTGGDHSPGIEGVGYDGLAVYSGEVVTHGAYSDGIFAVNFIGEVLVETYGLTLATGYDSDAIFAQNFVDSDVKVVTFGDTVAYDGVGIHVDAIGGFANIYNFGDVYGGRGGIVSYSELGTYIYNDGEIAGGNGYAIGVSGGAATIVNYGDIFGYAHLTANNDRVFNFGTWWAYGATTFGAGSDTFNNEIGGRVKVAPFSSVATTVTWTGLEVFNNQGLVDIRNGHTGDIFNMPGTIWTGSGHSTLAVDATLEAALTSDKMIIGAANGSTLVVVDDLTPLAPGALNFVGTTVVHGTSGSASNFTWVGRTKGFINYELDFFSGPVDWNIVALPSNAAFEMLKAPEMAQDFWRRTGDAWTAREQEVRDSMWGSTPPTRGEGWEMWAQAHIGGERVGSTETFDVHGFTFTPNLATNTDWRGFQMGGDNWTSKNWLWGFTGGFLEQNSSFRFDHNSFDITGWNVGAYTGFTSGAFFANGLIKGDWYDVKANMHTAPALETFSGNTWGVKGEMGFRLGGPHMYLEPLADIAWTTTHLDNANFPMQATTFTYSDATSTRGSIGARVGGQWGSIMPYVGVYAVEEFGGKNDMTMITTGGCPAACMSIEDVKPGSYGKADFGFTTTSWNGLEGFLKGEAEFGSHIDGFTGRMGVRWKW